MSKDHLAFHKIIEEQAKIHANAIAVSCNGATLTYQELNAKSNQLAHFLHSLGVQPEVLVGISVNRSVETIIAILGILKAGGAYIPIDPAYPKERINYMLSEAKISILLTQSALLEKFPDPRIKKISIDIVWEKINNFPHENLNNIAINGDNLAYVLYTSGSTGNPKGVMICHHSVINAYLGWKKIYQLKNTDCHLQMASFSFDVFTGDLVRALCFGGKLVLCPREILLIPEKLYALMVAEKINCAEFVPTVLRRLMEYTKAKNHSLAFMHLLICGSDNWSMNEYRKLQKLCSTHTRVINSYGVTEATIDSTYFEDKSLNQEHYTPDHAVPLGKPFPGTEIFLLDDKLNMVPDGRAGEIYISGNNLARGYFNHPDLTEQKFIKHVFNNHHNIRLYKTGDQGRYLANGNIEFLGRIDNQVKLRGIRIELSDIENVLNCFYAIRESLVTVYEDKMQNTSLIAYVITECGIEFNVVELRKFIQERLPDYMIPSLFIKLESLPLTPNGKLDRQALKELEILLPKQNYVEPRKHIENQLINLWEKMLGVKKIGILNNFFDLGGNSLLLAQLLSEIENSFSINIPPCKISNNLTIMELAKLIEKEANTDILY